MRLSLTSPDFKNGAEIPSRFRAEGRGERPTLKFDGMTSGTETLAIIMYDADSLKVHWIAWNIPASTYQLTGTDSVPAEGYGSNGKPGYKPPTAGHRYVFKVIAVNQKLDLQPKYILSEQNFRDAARRYILGEAQLEGHC